MLSDSIVQRFANGDDKFGEMLARARIEDPNFDLDAVEDEFNRTENNYEDDDY